MSPERRCRPSCRARSRRWGKPRPPRQYTTRPDRTCHPSRHCRRWCPARNRPRALAIGARAILVRIAHVARTGAAQRAPATNAQVAASQQSPNGASQSSLPSTVPSRRSSRQRRCRTARRAACFAALIRRGAVAQRAGERTVGRAAFPPSITGLPMSGSSVSVVPPLLRAQRQAGVERAQDGADLVAVFSAGVVGEVRTQATSSTRSGLALGNDVRGNGGGTVRMLGDGRFVGVAGDDRVSDVERVGRAGDSAAVAGRGSSSASAALPVIVTLFRLMKPVDPPLPHGCRRLRRSQCC